MKNTPIVILNRDRLTPIKKLVSRLRNRNYTNIVIIDNLSTYQPLLDWYKEEKLDVFVNNITENNCYALNTLAFNARHPKFVDIVNQHYAYTDSDLYPIDETPEDFVEDMIEMVNKHSVHKIGMSIKIDDLNLADPLLHHVWNYEKDYWTNGFQDEKMMLYPHPIDTTFSVYAPNTPASWSDNCFRAGMPYTLIHAPFYYTQENIPEDEVYYLRHQNPQSSNWSSKVKSRLNL